MRRMTSAASTATRYLSKRRVALLAVAATVALVTGSAALAQWPVRGADPQNTQQVDVPGPVEPALKWKSDTDGYELDGFIGGTGTRAHAVVDSEGRLVTGMKRSDVDPSRYDLLFLDPADGTIDMTVEEAGTSCEPAVANDGTIWAYLNVNERTEADPANPPPHPQASAWLVSIDPGTGEVLTHYSGDVTSPGVRPCVSSLTFGPDGSILSLENAQGAQGTVRSIDPLTGQPRWETVLTADPDIFSATGGQILVARDGSVASPLGSPGIAYVQVRTEPDRDLGVVKLDLTDGSILSIVEVPGEETHPGFLVDPGDGIVVSTIAIGNPDLRGHLTRVVDDGANLSVDWTEAIPVAGGAFHNAVRDMAAYGEHVVAWYASGNEIVAFRWDDGSVAWHHDSRATRTPDIAIDANGYIYVSGDLEVLNAQGRLVAAIDNREMIELLSVRGLGPLAFDPAPSERALEPSLLYLYSHGTTTWLAFELVHIDPRCYNANSLCGTQENDDLAGTAADELFITGNGADAVAAGGGNDKVLSGAGGDDVNGGGGNDVLSLGGGSDRALGGKGKDTIKGGGGNDVLNGGPGRDKLIGGKGKDTCFKTKGDILKGCERVKRAH